jgi:hypothetical protein
MVPKLDLCSDLTFSLQLFAEGVTVMTVIRRKGGPAGAMPTICAIGWATGMD